MKLYAEVCNHDIIFWGKKSLSFIFIGLGSEQSLAYFFVKDVNGEEL